jgi:hypothetical protein
MAYKAAYVARYGVPPIRNAKVNTQCLQLAKDVGVDNAEAVVTYYLSRDDAFYINASHPIGLCLVNAQKLWTEMRTHKEVTMTEARRLEKESGTRRAIDTYIREQEHE